MNPDWYYVRVILYYALDLIHNYDRRYCGLFKSIGMKLKICLWNIKFKILFREYIHLKIRDRVAN